jgi:choline dehydrogenase
MGEEAMNETIEAATYDYIVVGSGAGGGPVACNLARAGMRVLLLEAGSAGNADSYTYRVPAFHGFATEDPEMRWDYFVRHYLSDQQQCQDSKFIPEREGVLYPRSGTLGGCTAHNAMIMVYPPNYDWDAIATLTGDPSWRSNRMRSYFERLERCTYVSRPRFPVRIPRIAEFLFRLPLPLGWFIDRTRHGFDGWLTTSLLRLKEFIPYLDRELLDVLKSAAEISLREGLGDRPLTLFEGLSFFDPNDWRVQGVDCEGLWLVPLSISEGKRNGTREYIESVQQRWPDRLIVQPDALVSKVLFGDENTAVGVEFYEGRHLYFADPHVGAQPGASALPSPRRALASREVILAAGAFNTPQLLKLSGIGPADELTKLGIPVRVSLPGVGQNLQDRYEVGVVSELGDDLALLEGCAFVPPTPGAAADPCLTAWESGGGVYTSNGAILAITKKSDPSRPHPDLFMFGLPAYFRGYYPGYSQELAHYHNYFTWAILKGHTQNTAGSVRLRSTDPRDTPLIDFRYFEEGSDAAGEDLDSVVAGVEFVRRLMAHASGVVKREVLPGPDVQTTEDLRQFVRNQAWGHHASCTCKIGSTSDPMAVLDSRFRVLGTHRLRVVDASIFPQIPGFFIVSAVYMIAEKASDVILADARSAGGTT